MAATLNQGRFDVDATLEDLKDNPTLAASVMHAPIELAAEKGILPKPSGRGRAADDATTITLRREQASERAKMEASRARAEERDVTATVRPVAETLKNAGNPVNMPHFDRRLRSELSMIDQLTGMSAPSEAGAQLISNAVRHVFELLDKDFARAFKKAILSFDERGCAEVSTTNWFRTRSPTIVGIKTVLATPGGYRFEVEFHTADSYKAKVDNRDTYKQLQQLQELQPGNGEPLDLSIAEQLLARVRQACNKVVIPDGSWKSPTGKPRRTVQLPPTRPVGCKRPRRDAWRVPDRNRDCWRIGRASDCARRHAGLRQIHDRPAAGKPAGAAVHRLRQVNRGSGRHVDIGHFRNQR